jgi:hypothetical protein
MTNVRQKDLMSLIIKKNWKFNETLNYINNIKKYLSPEQMEELENITFRDLDIIYKVSKIKKK